MWNGYIGMFIPTKHTAFSRFSAVAAPQSSAWRRSSQLRICMSMLARSARQSSMMDFILAWWNSKELCGSLPKKNEKDLDPTRSHKNDVFYLENWSMFTSFGWYLESLVCFNIIITKKMTTDQFITILVVFSQYFSIGEWLNCSH